MGIQDDAGTATSHSVLDHTRCTRTPSGRNLFAFQKALQCKQIFTIALMEQIGTGKGIGRFLHELLFAAGFAQVVRRDPAAALLTCWIIAKGQILHAPLADNKAVRIKDTAGTCTPPVFHHPLHALSFGKEQVGSQCLSFQPVNMFYFNIGRAVERNDAVHSIGCQTNRLRQRHGIQFQHHLCFVLFPVPGKMSHCPAMK